MAELAPELALKGSQLPGSRGATSGGPQMPCGAVLFSICMCDISSHPLNALLNRCSHGCPVPVMKQPRPREVKYLSAQPVLLTPRPLCFSTFQRGGHLCTARICSSHTGRGLPGFSSSARWTLTGKRCGGPVPHPVRWSAAPLASPTKCQWHPCLPLVAIQTVSRHCQVSPGAQIVKHPPPSPQLRTTAPESRHGRCPYDTDSCGN